MSNSATPSTSIPKIHWGLNERAVRGGYFFVAFGWWAENI